MAATNAVPKTIAAWIKDMRLARGLKQTELAEALGESQPTISDWERGRTRIDAEDLIRVAQVLEVSRDDWSALVGTYEANPKALAYMLIEALERDGQ